MQTKKLIPSMSIILLSLFFFILNSTISRARDLLAGEENREWIYYCEYTKQEPRIDEIYPDAKVFCQEMSQLLSQNNPQEFTPQSPDMPRDNNTDCLNFTCSACDARGVTRCVLMNLCTNQIVASSSKSCTTPPLRPKPPQQLEAPQESFPKRIIPPNVDPKPPIFVPEQRPQWRDRMEQSRPNFDGGRRTPW